VSLQLNQINFAGNIARDPEIRSLAGGKTVAHFAVASNRRWKDASGQPQEEATFLDVEAWGDTAEFVGKYIGRGAGVLVVGRMRQVTWDDRETGKKRSKHYIVADRILFTDPKAKTDAAPQREEAGGVHAASAPHEPAGAHATASPFPAPLGLDEPPF
jgi:single-strand DNA-binding protein